MFLHFHFSKIEISKSPKMSYPLSPLSQSLLAPQGTEDAANVSASSSFAVPQLTSTQLPSSQQSQFQTQSQFQSHSLVPQSQSQTQFQTQSQFPMTSSGYQSSAPVVPNLTPASASQVVL